MRSIEINEEKEKKIQTCDKCGVNKKRKKAREWDKEEK